MKKIIISVLIICAFVLTAGLFAGCSDSQAEQPTEPEEQIEKISVVCSTFPQYDWTRQIIGEDNMNRFELSLLINNGIDLHSYNPSVQDVVAVRNSDVFIYVGGHSDTWVDEIMSEGANPDMLQMNLMEVLDGYIIVDPAHECDDPDHADIQGEEIPDEHVWMSLRCAKAVCAAITDTLCAVDPEKAQFYKENLDSYTAELSTLDAEYQAAVDNANVKTLVFADRFPFRYLTTDYGLENYAAFSGCSAETEASFVVVMSLANRINQLGLNVVMVTESSDKGIANTVIETTDAKNQKIVVLNSFQNVTDDDTGGGDTYIDVMKNNLAALKEAMSNSL